MSPVLGREQALPLALLGSLLLHVLVLASMHRGGIEGAATAHRLAPAAPLEVRIERVPAAAAVAPPGAHPVRPRPALRDRAGTGMRAMKRAPRHPAAQLERGARPTPASTRAATAATAATAAGAARMPLSPLNDELMKQVARHYAQPSQPSLPASTPRERRADELRRAARPDCLRSPAGGGRLALGGLLALPGLLYDAATGGCGM